MWIVHKFLPLFLHYLPLHLAIFVCVCAFQGKLFLSCLILDLVYSDYIVLWVYCCNWTSYDGQALSCVARVWDTESSVSKLVITHLWVHFMWTHLTTHSTVPLNRNSSSGESRWKLLRRAMSPSSCIGICFLSCLMYFSIFRPHCSTSWTLSVATGGVAWYVSRSVCCSVTTMNPAKMAEPIKTLFGMCAQMSPRNHVIDGVQIPLWEGALLRDDVKIFQHAAKHRSQCSCLGISMHAVDWHSTWLATNAVECRIKFLQWKVPSLFSKLFVHLLLLCLKYVLNDCI